MRHLVNLVKLSRLDYLIRHAATGIPKELAEQLDISQSSLFELIAFLKEEMNAPILYNKVRSSYMYLYTPKFYLGFERDMPDAAELNHTFGGNEIRWKNNGKLKDKIDDCIIDEEINFNDLYY